MVVATLDAAIVLRSVRGTRTVKAGDFFEGIMTTARADDELVTAVELPILPADTRVGFCEFSRRAGDFALGMALACYRLKDGVITDARLGVGGAEARPRRIAEAEAALNGRAPSPGLFEAAATAAAAAIDPLEDVNTNADYRRDLIHAMTRRALERAAA
jgi:carbon-monoxide dehydrogenase medium subunit